MHPTSTPQAPRRATNVIESLHEPAIPSPIEPAFFDVLARCKPESMTGPERLYATYQAARHAVLAEIPGALVECGVWRGGNMMAVALALLELDAADRELWLYDTFDGMDGPGETDAKFDGRHAAIIYASKPSTGGGGVDWCRATLETVRANMAATGYPMERVHLVPGRVEDTIPSHAPDSIAMLRLDTDFYSSTRHELRHLYPRLARGGTLIIDDYGSWTGCRDAVDEYFSSEAHPILLAVTDNVARIGVKTHDGAPQRSNR